MVLKRRDILLPPRSFTLASHILPDIKHKAITATTPPPMALLQDAKGAAQALHIPRATALPAPLPPQLARRDADDLTSGTLTVTVSPDRTCGFDGNDKPMSCVREVPCTWESGSINAFWCGWSGLFTTCYDNTAWNDPSSCNADCYSNSRNVFW